MVNDIITIIKELGFPVAICMYTLYTQNTTLQQLNDTMNANTRMIDRLIVSLDSEDLWEEEE